MAPPQPPRGLPANILDLIHHPRISQQRAAAPLVNPQPQPRLQSRDASKRDVPSTDELPTSTLPLNKLPGRLGARQATETVVVGDPDRTVSTVPGSYGALRSGPDPGTVVGIVLGSVAGFVLLLWLVYTLVNMGGRDGGDERASSYVSASVVSRRSKPRSERRHRSSPRPEVVEIRRTSSRGVPGAPIVMEAGPGPRPGSRRTVSVERVERRSSRVRAPPPPRHMMDEDEDEVVVIEEHTPRRARSSRRRSVSTRRESAFHDIDPMAYGSVDPRRSSRGR